MITTRLNTKGNSNTYRFKFSELDSWFSPADHNLSIEYETGTIDIPLNTEDLRRLHSKISEYLKLIESKYK